MLKTLFVWLGKAALVVLAGLGVLAVVVVWQLAGWLKGFDEPASKAQVSNAPAVAAPSQQKPADSVQTLVAQEAPAAPAAASECPCSTGAPLCVGPQGGRYCTRENGSKKYAASLK